MNRRKGFTLTEILIGLILTGVIILAVTSVDITSRRFFQAARNRARIQDEVKIAIAHITKNVQLGIGDIVNPVNPGFIIGGGGNQIEIQQDTNHNGMFDAGDTSVEYTYRGTPNFDIFYDPNIANPGDEVPITGPMIYSCNFAIGGTANEVEITIVSRPNPNPAVGLSPQNPETTLISSVILRGMSIN